ncbi:MAG: DUF917 domain-containing protein [Bacillota bacterium]|nr:DUF917 domain-containing protein [Bacillota bacterium]
MRKLGVQEIEDIALGAAVLGTGGGGDPHIGKLMAIQAVREYGPVELIDLEQVPDDAIIMPLAMMGAPTVIVEKIPNGDEFPRVYHALKQYLGREVYATMPIEAGGVNSMIPVASAARLGIPLVDADGMGRAFPELQMVTFHLGGITATPMAMTDEKGNLIILSTVTNLWTEHLARSATVVMGGSAMIAIYPLTGAQAREWAIRGIVTRTEEIGKTLRLWGRRPGSVRSQAAALRRDLPPVVATMPGGVAGEECAGGASTGRRAGPGEVPEGDVVQAVLALTAGYLLFRGKVVDVARRTVGGFARGEAVLEGLDEFRGQSMRIHFQNENLIALRDGEVRATVPDLITVLDAETARPITTEGLRYGYRAVVVGMPCDSRWRTPRGLETVGPRYFGYDVDYIPIEQRMAGQRG